MLRRPVLEVFEDGLRLQCVRAREHTRELDRRIEVNTQVGDQGPSWVAGYAGVGLADHDSFCHPANDSFLRPSARCLKQAAQVVTVPARFRRGTPSLLPFCTVKCPLR